MIFTPELAQAILGGGKTVTRRVISVNPLSPWYEGGCSLKVGGSYAVQDGRGKPAIGRIKIVSVKLAPCPLDAEISEDEARREGFYTVEAFLAAWEAINGHNGADVWRIEFKVDDV